MTREEAIQIIRDIYHTDEEMKALESLIPELRGSEDERIRRALVEYFGPKVQLDFVRGVPIQKIRDWLEKQKPMYNLEIPSGDVAPAEEDGPFDEDDFLENELSAFLQNYDKEYDDDAAVSDVARHFYEIGKKQKEQKPAEWSEEDERMLSRCEKSIESSKQFADSDTFKKAKDNEIDWLENRFNSLRPSWKPSDQDELMKLKYAGTSTKLD